MSGPQGNPVAEADRGRRPKGNGGVSQHQAHAPVFLSGVTRPRPFRVRWMNIPARFISSVCFVSIEL